MERLILAHDLGTSGNKATLFSEDGTMLASATHSYETSYQPGGVAEQDPDDWWRAVCISTAKVMENFDADRIAAISSSGTMMGCLCVDSNGVPLRNHMLYCDMRATSQVEFLKRTIGEDAIYDISGNPTSAAYSGAKYLWIRENQPGIYNQTRYFLQSKDYLNFKLTGRLATDPTDASGTNLYDLREWCWSENLIARAGLDLDKFPELLPSTAVLGELTGEAAAALGLKKGVPVIVGAADGMCAGVGAGSVSHGNTYNCLGSSAWIATTTDIPIIDVQHRVHTFAHAVPGMYHPMGTMLVGGGVYAWLKRTVCMHETFLAEQDGGSAYDLMNQAAADSPPGARGLIFLPHLLGERTPRWDPLARAGFIGLDMTHTRGDLIRAVLEGVILNLAITVDIYRDMGVEVDKMLVIGGGAKGDLWRQIMADIYNVELQRPHYLEEATSIGAAILAGIGAGVYKDFSVVDKFNRIVDRISPDPANRIMYDERKKLFDQVYKALEPLLPKLARAREWE